MTEIQQNRWDQLVRRVSNIVGGGSQVNDTLNELFPTIDVENVPGELLFLSGTKVAIGSSTLQASVGDTNHHQLFNPVDSQVLALVTNVWMLSTSNQSFRMGLGTAAITTNLGGAVLRDTRTGITVTPTLQNRTVQQAGGIAATSEFRSLASVQIQVNDPNGVFILFPGTGVTVATVGTNIVSTVNYFWRERVFEPAEVNF